MLKVWKRTLRVALVPMALVALVIGTCIPASAQTISGTQSPQGQSQGVTGLYHAVPNSLNW